MARHGSKRETPHDPAGSPAVWEFAGLLLTYRCTARCACCYVNAGPGHAGYMSTAAALHLWRGLDELAAAHGRTMRIHLAGGEPTCDWPRLIDIVQAARAAGLSPVEKIETNAGWATDDAQTRDRLRQLDALGVRKLVVSTDVYHQEFVPFERVRRCVELARAELGAGRVTARWWDFYSDPVDVRALGPRARAAAFEAALQRHHERLNGRAAAGLAPLLPRRPAAALAGERCAAAILGSRHVHIDPHGNVFPGTCAGVILGRVALPDESEMPSEPGRAGGAVATYSTIGALWNDLAARAGLDPVLAALVHGGGHGLLELARGLGYREQADGYADKCHLCSDVRAFLHAAGHWPACIGPRECYAS